jgi:hypothetical protein
MATKPTENLPGWAPADSGKRVEPDGSRKTTGYSPLEAFPSQVFNWLLYSISLWLQYIANFLANENRTLTATGSIVTDDNAKTVFINSSAGAAMGLQLPDPSENEGMKFTIKDVGGVLSTYPVSLLPFDTEAIEGYAGSYSLDADFGIWVVYCDGTNWHLL